MMVRDSWDSRKAWHFGAPASGDRKTSTHVLCNVTFQLVKEYWGRGGQNDVWLIGVKKDLLHTITSPVGGICLDSH